MVKQHTISVADVALILSENKETIKPMEWIEKRTNANPCWIEYMSACKIKSSIQEDLFFIATYRAPKTKFYDNSSLELSEIFNLGIVLGGHRIFAVDTSDTPHTNKIGISKPYYKKIISSRSHVHIWVEEGYGYAEPISEEFSELINQVSFFLPKANLKLFGDFIHPLSGKQMDLIS